MAQMNNPNIVNIYDSGEEVVTLDNGRTEHLPYLGDGVCEGPDAARHHQGERPAVAARDTEHVMIGLLSALEYSHRMGIIHRDIKPGNIMISEQGVVKVMDFGIARALDDSATTMTKSQGVVGTAQYLSPSRRAAKSVDMRSDLYSAGCVLYDAHRPAAVHRRLRRGDRLPACVRSGHQAECNRARPAGHVGFDLREGHGQGPPEPLRDGHGVQERHPRVHERRHCQWRPRSIRSPT